MLGNEIANLSWGQTGSMPCCRDRAYLAGAMELMKVLP